MKYLRKILLSASLFGAMCVYAEDYSVARIGLGGVYSLQQPSGEKDITNAGGYLALWSRGTLANERFLVQAARIGKATRPFMPAFVKAWKHFRPPGRWGGMSITQRARRR